MAGRKAGVETRPPIPRSGGSVTSWHPLRVGSSQNMSPAQTTQPTDHLVAGIYREYNPDSAGTRRDECLVGDSRRQVLVDGDKDIEVVQE